MSHRSRHCAVCASSTQQVIDHACRAAHRATLGTAVAAALPAHVLPNASCSGVSERAHALPHHPPPAPQAPRRRSPETQSATHVRSLASTAATATLRTRSAHSLPRALAPRRRAPGAILARSRAGSAVRVPLLAATAAVGKVAAAATAAATTCCMHTAQPARDRQGARDTRHARGQLRTRSR